jgi:anti-sigma regulatory factor (Ser/Thr protein kinase)
LTARSDQAERIVQRDYQASRASVCLARRLAARQARHWALPLTVTQDLTLAVSELVTNAVRVSPIAQIVRVHISLEDSPVAVRLAVWDASATVTQPAMPQLTLEAIDIAPLEDRWELNPFGGWGLAVAEAVSDACGVCWVRPERRAGKWVWIRIEL